MRPGLGHGCVLKKAEGTSTINVGAGARVLLMAKKLERAEGAADPYDGTYAKVSVQMKK
jgi:hypothetical protein